MEAADSPLDLKLLGPFELWVRGDRAPRFRSHAGQWLLAMLVLRRGREIDRSWLAATLWPDSSEDQALYNLRRNLTDLRRVLGAEAGRLLSPQPRTIRLDLTDATCDLIEFDDAVGQGGDSALNRAVDLYRGSLLEGCDEEWIDAERGDREEAYLRALEQLASRATPSRAGAYLRRIIAADPLRESAHRQLMESLAAAGDYAAVTQAFRDLRSMLLREMNTEPHASTVATYQRLQQEGGSAAAPRFVRREEEAPAPAPAGVLPNYLTPLIGRDREREEIAVCLEESALVTLTGAGGVGKTRLAAAVAGQIGDRYPEGPWFVDLSPLSDPALVAEVIAGVLGLYEEPGRPWIEILAQALRARGLLLILDNCEHLLESCAEVSRFLLAACPRLRILATSRQPLGVTGERVRRVPSLSQPPESGHGEQRAEDLLRYEAVRLFVTHAEWSDPAFRLTAGNAGSVAAICRQLDGIPLAVELAAARVRGMTAAELHSRLSSDFALLTAGPGGAGGRQRTLRAMMDWSYALLSPDERLLFRRLSIFSGGWQLGAVETVCSGAPLSGPDVLDLLFSLVDRSLVVMEPETGRYRLLETIRQYSAEQLLKSAEAEELRARHMRWCVSYVEEAASARAADGSPDWIRRLDLEHANFRAALDGALVDSAAPDVPMAAAIEPGLRLAIELRRYWVARDLYSEGMTYLDGLLARAEPEGDARLRARGWSALGQTAYFQGDYARAMAAFDRALTHYRPLADGTEEIILRGMVGIILCHQGDYSRARALLEEAWPICERLLRYEGVVILDALAFAAREQGDSGKARAMLERAIALGRKTGEIPGQANCLFNMGYVAFDQADYTEAAVRFTAAMSLFQSIGNRTGEARCWCSLGSVAHMEGDQDAALEWVDRALEINRRIGYAPGQAWNLRVMGDIMVSSGRYLEALPRYEAALAIDREHGSVSSAAYAMGGLAKVTLYVGNYRKSYQWHREALQTMESLGMKLGMVVILESLADLYRMSGHGVPAVQLLSATERHREEMDAPMNTFVREGRRNHLADLRAVLGTGAFEEAWEAGAAMALGDSVALAYAEEVAGDRGSGSGVRD